MTTPVSMIALHRDTEGELLTTEVAAIELLNLVRACVAASRFIVLAAKALHEHPALRASVRDDPFNRRLFVLSSGA